MKLSDILYLLPVLPGILWSYKYYRLESAISVVEASRYRRWLKTWTHWIILTYVIFIGMHIWVQSQGL
jgi:hypothetical protein